MSGRQAAGKKERDIGIGADNPVQKTISNWERRKGFGIGRNRMISLQVHRPFCSAKQHFCPLPCMLMLGSLTGSIGNKRFSIFNGRAGFNGLCLDIFKPLQCPAVKFV